MKQVLAVLSLLMTLLSQTPAFGQGSPDQTLAVIKEIQAQQVTIAENQAKIEAKLATVGEAVRLARIYSSRGGR